ncbi:DUF262 domain-containing protein [Gloeocapsopsis dulcis]|uniref:DUF262 domain-containing protein n=1 Tax=Gloeocapsopsis dulcis AAB1 = 1H9 TaxID=1433147 RepID=A0A6N8G2K9_9CHRO|nr:DUF262 domain-containing protein [Gloeocapsopsis dulcis]MUL38577.1 hypothetical protein [Gloeocapsopsis dulcis AAB1 = 1H9]WNN91137.1 DUF262 domain-containing HNH endonuclease family protein [Gloeocapsopsis dulcis]
MKASETTLRNLLEGTKQFQIPLFQRSYSWKKENWETLWEDLMSLYREEIKGFYFLGPIVTQAIPGTADGISPFVVIDGQQRLTTLTIVLAVLRNYLRKSDKSVADEVQELYLINKFKKDNDFYKVLPTQGDREAYQSIITGKTLKDLKKEGSIYEAYKFFDAKFKKPDLEENIVLDLTKFKPILLEQLLLVNITSDDSDNPYLIFESLNNKGEELSQVDLIRNYIFMKIPANEQEAVFEKIWSPLQEKFKQNLKNNKSINDNEYAIELTNAFWFYLRKDGKAISQKEVYKAIKQKFDSSQLDTISQLEEIIQFANYYLRLNFENEELNITLRKWFKRLKRLDFTTCHIFLLNIYRDYEEEKLSLEEFRKVIRYLESYFVRRWVTGISTKALGTVFNDLYNKVKKKNSSDLVDGLRRTLIEFKTSQIFPEDAKFRDALIQKSLYSKTSGVNDRVKLLLESIEAELSKEQVNPENLTLEHIMPQTLDTKWKIVLGTNYSNIHKKWLHTLGNLTLTGYNSELSNKCYEDKLHYLHTSNVTLNQYFKNIDTWNEEAIKNRAEYLADIAVKICLR